MSPISIIRAWKDAEYRQSLSAAELARMPAHPAGLIKLTDDDLESVAGGRRTRVGIRFPQFEFIPIKPLAARV